jgi:phospholipase/carboxylesterase
MLPSDVMSELVRPEEGFYLSEVESPSRLPVLTFLPTGYEPGYAYPLVLFLHGCGGSEKQLMRLGPALSRRNYVSIALRGPVPAERHGQRRGFRWGAGVEADAYTEEYVFRALEQVDEMYHIHNRRIFLVGVGEGAELAYRLGIGYPERFRGIVSLNGCMPQRGPLFRLHSIRRLRVMIGHGIANARVPLATARRDFQLLYTAGLDVDLRTYPTTNRLHPAMLRDVDRWIMRIVNG